MKRVTVKRFEWLDKGFVYGPFYTLCLSEKDFLAAIKHCNEALTHNDFGPWADKNKACTHNFKDDKDRQCCVVCINMATQHSGIEIAGLLVHEAVHIFQKWCSNVGEYSPSAEFEAYSIQWLSQQLMWEYTRQVKAKP